MDKKTQAHRLSVQRGWLIYMGAITIICSWFGAIFAINDLIVHPVLIILNLLSAVTAYVYGTYVIWINYILVAAAIGYSVYCLYKDRKFAIFFSVLIVAALNIVGSIGVQQFALQL